MQLLVGIFVCLLPSVYGFLDGLNVQNQACDGFKCPPPKVLAPNLTYRPHANGCGTQMIQVANEFDFTDCCNWHDACYATCGMAKATCERRFDRCLSDFCTKLVDPEDRKKCESSKSIYVLGVQIMGCPAYTDSQREACTCVKTKEDAKEAYATYVEKFIQDFAPQVLTTTPNYVTDLLQQPKYHNKQPLAMYRLLKKYPKALEIVIQDASDQPTFRDSLDEREEELKQREKDAGVEIPDHIEL